MKKLWFIAILLMVLSLNLIADDVIIGTGTTYTYDPFNAFYGYGRSASLYTAEEIGLTGNISHLSWEVGSTGSAVQPIKVYAKLVDEATLTVASWATLTEDATLLYDDDHVFAALGWSTIDITDFNYDGTQNLLILCESNYGGGGASGMYPQFRYTVTTGKHLYARADNNPPTGNLTVNTYRPNIKISFPSTTAPNAAVIGAPANGATNVAISPTFAWSSGTGGTPTGYKVYIGTSNPPTTLVAEGAAATYVPTEELAYETQYFWKVVPYNEFGDATDCPVWSFTTRLDPTRPIPFLEDFNAGTTWPSEWINSGMLISATHGNASNGVYKNIWGTGTSKEGSFTSCPIGPLAAVSEIKFDYRYMAYSGYPSGPYTPEATDEIQVQISTDDGETFETIYTINEDNHVVSTEFATPTVPVLGYAGEVVRVRFFATKGNGTGDYYVDFDNIIVRETPSAPVFAIDPIEKDFGITYMPAGSAPQIFTISNDGLGTLIVNSVALGGADVAHFELTDTNTYPVSLATNETITVQARFNPLTAGEKSAVLNVAYNDGAAGSFAAPLTGNSVDATITELPYTDSFELNNTNNSTSVFCWAQELETGTKYWTVYENQTSYNREPRTGDFSVALQYSGNAWMYRPVQLTGGTSYSVEIYARQDGSTATNANLAIKYGDAPNAAAMTNTIVDVTPLINGDYQRLRGAFEPETTGIYYIGVLGWINGSPYYITIDDFMIEETPAVAPNPAVLVSPADEAEYVPVFATLSWIPATDGGDPTAYELYVGTTNPPTEMIVEQEGTSYTFAEPLEEETEYFWKVVAKNSTGTADDSEIWSFTTTTSPIISSFPFIEGFEGGNVHNSTTIQHWTQERVTGTNDWTINETFVDYNRTPRTGNYNVTLKFNSSAWMFRPIELEANTVYTFEMWARQDVTAGANLKVCYGDSPTATAMTNIII
ncbi:MAG: choice-of-anchor D domain-containing protein, partial [Candidatus Cloacimonetes bacterium]|nr:choice-of-anchor D domain-containing protein [Candidatus Cloacimonadota bacterium]